MADIIGISEDFVSQVGEVNNSDAADKLKTIIRKNFDGVNLRNPDLGLPDDCETVEQVSEHLIKTHSDGRGLIGFFKYISGNQSVRTALQIPGDFRFEILCKILEQKVTSSAAEDQDKIKSLAKRLLKDFCDENHYHPRFADQIKEAIKIAHMFEVLGDPIIDFAQDEVLSTIEGRLKGKDPAALEKVNNGLKALAKMVGPDVEKELASLKKQNPIALLKKIDLKLFSEAAWRVNNHRADLLLIEDDMKANFVDKMKHLEDLALNYDAKIFRKKCAELLLSVKRDYAALKFGIIENRIFVDATNAKIISDAKSLEDVKLDAFKGLEDIVALCQMPEVVEGIPIVEIHFEVDKTKPYLELRNPPSEQDFLKIKSLYEEVSQIIITADKTLSNSFKRTELQGLNKVSKRELFSLYRDYIIVAQDYLSEPENYDFIEVGRGAPDIKLGEVREKVIRFLRDNRVGDKTQSFEQKQFYETEVEIKFLLQQLGYASKDFKPFEYPSQDKMDVLKALYSGFIDKALKKYVKETSNRAGNLAEIKGSIDSFLATPNEVENVRLKRLVTEFQEIGKKIAKVSATHSAEFNGLHDKIGSLFDLLIKFEAKQKAGLLLKAMPQFDLPANPSKTKIAEELKELLDQIVAVDEKVRGEITDDLTDIGDENFMQQYVGQRDELLKSDLSNREHYIVALGDIKSRIEEVVAVVSARNKQEALSAKKKANSKTRYREPLKLSSNDMVERISAQNKELSAALSFIREQSARYGADARETAIYKSAVTTEGGVADVITLYQENIKKLSALKRKIESELVKRARKGDMGVAAVIVANEGNFIGGLQSEIDLLKPDVGVDAALISSLREQIASLTEQNKQISDKILVIEREKLSLAQKNEELVEENKTLKAQLVALTELKNNNAELLAKIEQLNQKIIKLEKDNLFLQKTNLALQEANSDLREVIAELQETISQQQEILSTLQQRNEELEDSLKSKQQQPQPGRKASGSISPRGVTHVLSKGDKWVTIENVGITAILDFQEFVKNFRENSANYDDKIIRMNGDKIVVNETLYESEMNKYNALDLIKKDFQKNGKRGVCTQQEVIDALARINTTRKDKSINLLQVDIAEATEILEKEKEINLDESMRCAAQYLSFASDGKKREVKVRELKASTVMTM